MAKQTQDNQEKFIKDAVQKFVDAQLEGHKPDLDEFVKRYPGCEHQIRQMILNVRKIDTLFDSLVQTDESDFEVVAAEQDLVGRKVGNFEVTEIIGRGGMGVVYLARDTRLKRSVAIKSMPAQLKADSTARMRFSREAELLASLNHPNIAVIHDIIEQQDVTGYLVLEYVPGQTLSERIKREPLELEEALSIAAQIAEAVSAAHEKGVVHRDLKPGNIKLTPEGRVKVLDFGLAKPSVKEDTDIEITSTEPGRIIGTPAYMSPEQARGKPADHRTDIWSFGCLLYEMLTGRLPFEGETATDTLARIIERQPDWDLLPNETPENIRVLLKRCLEKDPERRLDNIADAAIEISETLSRLATATVSSFHSLWCWALAAGLVLVAIVVGLNIVRWREQPSVGAGTARIKSLVVLPFEYLSDDPNQEYFADAMTDELITYLGRISALRVISRQSVMRYKGSDKSLPEIARELNVDAVVEGSVLCGAEQIRITAQLIGAVPEKHLWAESYDRDFGDIVILSSEVAQAIAREIQVALTPEEQTRLTSARPVNREAYELYRRGKEHYFKLTRKELEKANEYFLKAIEIDPNYAQPYAGLAGSYVFQLYAGHLTVDEAESKILPILNKAREIDNTLAETHNVLSGIHFVLYWNWAEGINESKLAIVLNPNLAEAHYNYAYYLMAMGRFDEAISEAKRAIRLDPLSYLYEGTLAYVYSYARRYKQAIEQYQRLEELDPKNSKPYVQLARIYEQMGSYDEAIKARRKVLTISGRPLEEIEELAQAYRESGPKGYWMYILEKLKSRDEQDPYHTARIYAQLGDKEQAFAWLEKAYEKHDGGLYRLKVEPLLDPLRSDPRFDDLLRRMNIPD